MSELIGALALAFGIAVVWFLIDERPFSKGGSWPSSDFWEAETNYYDGPVKDWSRIYTDCDYKNELGRKCPGVINGIMVQSSVCWDCVCLDKVAWDEALDKMPFYPGAIRDAITMGSERVPLPDTLVFESNMRIDPETGITATITKAKVESIEPLPPPVNDGLPRDRGECEHCGTWGDAPGKCVSCGAPLPKTQFQVAWEHAPRYVIKSA